MFLSKLYGSGNSLFHCSVEVLKMIRIIIFCNDERRDQEKGKALSTFQGRVI